MRIVINGWFSEQLTTGSGQYLTALLEWLPRVGASTSLSWCARDREQDRQISKSQIADRTTNHAIRNTHHV